MLWMFQAVPPPIIRSSKTVCAASGTLSNFYCYLPLSWKSSNSYVTVAGSSKVLTKNLMLYIQFWAPDDGRRNHLKHVEHFAETNKLCNVVSCSLYLEIRFRCTDPWTSNANVLLPSSYILWIGLTMATKQQSKHVAALLNSKVVFWPKTLHFWPVGYVRIVFIGLRNCKC